MKKFTRTLLSVGLAASLYGASAQADTIKIALAGPATGPVAQYGDMQKIGVMAAIEDINNAGGINGDKLEGVIYDDACDPKQAVAVANKIVNDDIQLVVGHLCSSSTEPASDIYEEEGILMITAASTSPSITEKGHQMVFRTIGLDSLQGTLAAEHILNNVKPKTIAVIHDKQQYGEGLATTVKSALEKGGLNITMFEGVTAGDKDFSALIAKLKKEGVDFVYYGGYHPELGLILRQSKEKGFNAQFMGPEGIVNSDLAKIAGEASEGVLATAPKSFDQNPVNQARVEAIKAKGEDPTGPFVFTAYAAVELMKNAIEKTGGTDPEKMAEHLRSNPLDTAIGKIAYDAKGDLTESTFQVYQLHKDGSKTAVK
ncbi:MULTISPECIES: branched-chain amino acid ABC transporter substrate-binding protein [Neptunomonas]|uniref:Branched-chain amino acid ABC transporter substrate-binding protein n=1 Tax=Neptunomonas marina TaxID=1815562 RepID=A0A437Q663_9GAMM|nr:MULTISPECIES: branched-chain amino acid ABC transporter substrate-binding protein [Neptunomonas]RVU29991.1 branched-chain amino acid ABC transporter substrate-binding protein [Neptunomonas marina]